ncbi:FAD/NAD(P)-binding domain-containing protein [Tilletiaria anomala UBC 951]|uniref:FAD/NAD(P)-binding domain-containing protein n=1 Tax=Tilletiaria anomala (strain ATCC 24038 / CBS 436.72 / UBC 951) TaxID=1037660 RepID=A0A066W5W2_TILAU|nr:FAD/NAD(P)-binding domain-containing protein [Tilletiaria anomala UBC 951]KDN46464.1 FAD/NAD(P)-binding domain-containing protein [Tilletiaria anomala UBC 951]
MPSTNTGSTVSERRAAVIEESKTGGKHAHGTHNYPDPLVHIDKVAWDVTIIGAGPAGLMLASSLARFGGHDVLVIDERSEPTTAGRADGIQPRTIEVFRNMEPLGTEFVERSAPSYERTFWDPRSDGERGIVRTRRVQSFPTNMEIQDNCTLGLQQGLIEGAFLRDMERHGQRVTRPWAFKDFVMRPEVDNERPVEVTLVKMEPVVETKNEGGAPTYSVKATGETKTIRTKYLIGCDGGRSAVRTKLEKSHGFEFKGDWVDTLWAALDCVVDTNFPDVRKIAAIHSAKHGALYIFPRENNQAGDPIIRCYTQVNRLSGEKSKESALEARNKVTKEQVMQAIQEIAYPYKFKFKSVEWFTVYPIGQRLVSRYSLPAGQEKGWKFPAHRVAICGDACHTHSPKAGQGMNTAVIDSQALAWRINLVEKGLASPDILLGTYHDERHATGKQLIDFDSEYAALFSNEIPKNQPELAKLSEDELKEHFIGVQRRNAAFTTGAGVAYADSVLNHRDLSRLGFDRGYRVGSLEAGWRLQPAWATRWSNSQPVRIIHEIQFDAPGGFRIYVCAGELKRNQHHLLSFARHLQSPQSFLAKYRANHKAGRLLKGAYNALPAALNTGLDGGYSDETNPFFHLLLIVKQNRFGFELEDVAELGPLRAMVYADDVEAGGSRTGNEDGDETVGGLHRKWGLDPNGGIVVCRPDGYVGAVFPLDQGEKGWGAMEKYFAGFLTPASGFLPPKL